MHKIVHFFSHLVHKGEHSHHAQLYQEDFVNFVAQYGKNYGTHEEWQFRLNQFQQNMKFIEEYNSSNDADKHEIGINFMADWSPSEYKSLLGYKPELKKPNANVYSAPMDDSSVPDTVDWNKDGAVTPVKNQGMCGSCWAFSTTGSMEGREFTKTKTLVSLSEQQLVDCSKNGNQGCNGGLMDYAFEYAEKHNMETEAEYPYKGVDGTCKEKNGKYHVTKYTDVAKNDPKALQAAVAEGPVSVAIDASGIIFQLYMGQIISSSLLCRTQLDHGVLVVGYGTENGTDYWLLKNSWGPSWGIKGFFKIKREMSKNGPGICGLQQQASFPDME